MNALAAIAAARQVGVLAGTGGSPHSDNLETSTPHGVARYGDDIAVYDDFATHPTAIATTVEGLRKKVGKARILAGAGTTLKYDEWYDEDALARQPGRCRPGLWLWRQCLLAAPQCKHWGGALNIFDPQLLLHQAQQSRWQLSIAQGYFHLRTHAARSSLGGYYATWLAGASGTVERHGLILRVTQHVISAGRLGSKRNITRMKAFEFQSASNIDD
ncbi:hypothetical protein FQR65_LT20888 [Abscondita terminalis]|nr:hypothetical protein FQR65_LT20888 [Abscondita terminalis]